MSFTDRDKQVMLAASQGVLDALLTVKHLGDAARGRGLEARTLKGDAYETAFEWARQEQGFYEEADNRELHLACVCNGGCPRCRPHEKWAPDWRFTD